MADDLKSLGFYYNRLDNRKYFTRYSERSWEIAMSVKVLLEAGQQVTDLDVHPMFEATRENIEQGNFSIVTYDLKDGRSENYLLFERHKYPGLFIARRFGEMMFNETLKDTSVYPRRWLKLARELYAGNRIVTDVNELRQPIEAVAGSAKPIEEQEMTILTIDDMHDLMQDGMLAKKLRKLLLAVQKFLFPEPVNENAHEDSGNAILKYLESCADIFDIPVEKIRLEVKFDEYYELVFNIVSTDGFLHRLHSDGPKYALVGQRGSREQFSHKLRCLWLYIMDLSNHWGIPTSKVTIHLLKVRNEMRIESFLGNSPVNRTPFSLLLMSLLDDERSTRTV